MTADVIEEKLVQFDEDHAVLAGLAGLKSRTVRLLQSEGYKVTVVSTTPMVFRPDLDKLRPGDLEDLSARSDQIHALGLICDHPGGFMINAPTGWGKSHLICQAAQILPDKRIVIAAPGTEIVDTLYGRLKGRIRDLGVVGGGSNSISRVTLCTMESLHKLAGFEVDLFLGDEAHRFAGPATSAVVASVFPTAKCVGLSATPTGRTDGADLVTEALFGPVVFHVDYQQGVDRGSVVPIEVFAYHIDNGPYVNEKWPAFIKDKVLIHKNPTRNCLIADIARRLGDETQKLIVVDRAEHGFELLKLLPEYSFVFGTVSSPEAVSLLKSGEYPRPEGVKEADDSFTMDDSRRVALREAFERGELKSAIATGIWDTGVDFQKLEALIRADGLGSDIKSTQTPGRLSRTDGGEKTCGYLVDFLDKFNRRTYGKSLARLRAYARHGWHITKVYEPEVVSEETMRKVAK